MDLALVRQFWCCRAARMTYLKPGCTWFGRLATPGQPLVCAPLTRLQLQRNARGPNHTTALVTTYHRYGFYPSPCRWIPSVPQRFHYWTLQLRFNDYWRYVN